MQCPKCRFERQDDAAECARCGIVFARFAEVAARNGETHYHPPPPPPPQEPKDFWRALLLEEEGGARPGRFVGRTVLYGILVVWGFRFLFATVASNYSGESFLHWINLPFHEAGHMIFLFFGDFLHTLGGTLGQLLVPSICLGAFLFRTRDPFGASVALWWLAENFMDVAPYMADARSGELLLLGGVTGREVPGYHDWENILGDLHLLAYDHRLAGLTYAFGRLLMIAALLWGGRLLARQWRALRADRS